MNSLEKFIKEKIPLSQSMQISITRLSESEVEIFCPLKPNRNHMDTAFGGSLGSALLLSCYAWLFNILKIRGIDSHIVVTESHIKYLLPVEKDFTVTCQAPASIEYEKFLKVIEKKGRAKLTLRAQIRNQENILCEMSADFVALKS